MEGLYSISRRILRQAKRDSWRIFCGNIETISGTFRLRRIHATTSFVQIVQQRVMDQFWEIKLLVDVHFPLGQDSDTRAFITWGGSQRDYGSNAIKLDSFKRLILRYQAGYIHKAEYITTSATGMYPDEPGTFRMM